MYVNGAGVYDHLMGEAPYEEWLRWTKRYLEKEGITTPTIADIGCGTGTLMSMLIAEGYDVQGIDVSQEMLAIADEKIRANNGVSPRLRTQNMAALQLDEPVDVMIVYCDALNYLLEETEVVEAFHAFYQNLKAGGGLLFDIHSLYKMKQEFPYFSYGDGGENVALIWNSFPLEDMSNAVEHELTFFERQVNGHYLRYDECHQQRTFSISTYERWLQSAGFKDIEITADFEQKTPTATSERIFFTAKKAFHN
ncbi:cyclopropane fatty-acyl-phospholipid synthase-like methyltransferase [Geomicrobium halophilum]|uniref:Cyclopropane fatty-acyl-phospholipid synthase-like methyltransferase n=1 Tax=Geomicrobium halophilum TaxID=549000 RepID=A0A841PIV3_9BACL|nr:class I SAM-dependent methyltransferase [Geomicrobium halophilum]MBB6448807.1 cyclopropane fatty-acyl-phospholipid synthase-like methyltransferase [Geomicrobium halophilum]